MDNSRINSTSAYHSDYTMNSSAKNSSLEIFNFSHSQAVLILEEHLKDEAFEGPIKSAIVSGYVILIVAGVITNLIVSLVIIGNSRLRIARNFFIVNLSFTDLMLCLFCMPFTLVELLHRKWNLGAFLCRCVPFAQSITIFVSSATVSAIALDRQDVIVGFGSPKPGRKDSNMLMYTLILWIFSLVLSLPIIFSKTVTTVSLANLVLYEKCIEQWPSSHAKAIYTMLILIAQFFIPSVVLTVTHLRIKSYLNQSVPKCDSKSPRASARVESELRRNNHATLILSFISVVFASSWLPWNAFNLMADFDLLAMSPENFYLAFAICHMVAMSSSVTNPILYGWFNSNIRRELLQIKLPTLNRVSRVNGPVNFENTYVRSSEKLNVEKSSYARSTEELNVEKNTYVRSSEKLNMVKYNGESHL